MVPFLSTLALRLLKMDSRGLRCGLEGGRQALVKLYSSLMGRMRSAPFWQVRSSKCILFMSVISMNISLGGVKLLNFLYTIPCTQSRRNPAKRELSQNPFLTQYLHTPSLVTPMMTETQSFQLSFLTSLQEPESLLRWKVDMLQANSSIQSTTDVLEQRQGYIMFAQALLVALYRGLFFSIGELFKFLQLYPIQPRCLDIIDLENLLFQTRQIYSASSTAVQKGWAANAFSIIFSITKLFLYFLFFCREAIKAPPLTILLLLNYLYLCKMVEQPKDSLLPIYFRFSIGFFPSSLVFMQSANILFISYNFSRVIVVRIFLLFLRSLKTSPCYPQICYYQLSSQELLEDPADSQESQTQTQTSSSLRSIESKISLSSDQTQLASSESD